MANPDHLNTLRQGVDAWNASRKRKPRVTPDLSEASLCGARLAREWLALAYCVRLWRRKISAALRPRQEYCSAPFCRFGQGAKQCLILSGEP